MTYWSDEGDEDELLRYHNAEVVYFKTDDPIPNSMATDITVWTNRECRNSKGVKSRDEDYDTCTSDEEPLNSIGI
jgi:hypothetical protein